MSSDLESHQIRILIVDDHALFRAGLRRLLEADPALRVIAEADSGFGVIATIQNVHPDLMLLDLALPGLNGMDVLRELAATHLQVKTIVLTAAIADDAVVEAVRNGAAGILMKTAATELLFRCVYSVMAGEYWIGRSAVATIAQLLAVSEDGAHSRCRPFGLTPRELEIAKLVAQGYSNREVSRRLGISGDTVKHHLSKAFDKTGVSTRLELALFVTHHDSELRH